MQLDEITETISGLTKREKLEFLIELGSELDELESEKRTEAIKVPGCVSGVYISVEEKEGKYYFKGFSEALIVKGFLKIVLDNITGKTKDEILAFENELISFVEKNGLAESMISSRANAFGNIFSYIKVKINV